MYFSSMYRFRWYC